MNPKFFLYNTTLSAQLLCLVGLSLKAQFQFKDELNL